MFIASRMFFKALLLLLPAVAYAQIRIRVVADEKQNQIWHYGEIEETVSDTERQTWQISDEQLKDMVQYCSGKRFDNVYVRSPLVGCDPYKIHNKQEVYRVFRPYNSRILNVSYQTVLLATQYFTNKNNATVFFDAGIEFTGKQTVSVTWQTEGLLTVGQKISHSFILGPYPNILYHTGPWGKNMTTYKKIPLGTVVGISDVTVELQPGEPFYAELTATKGSMLLEVNYSSYLYGFIASNYKNNCVNDLFLDITNCSIKANKPKNIFFSDEVIKIEFFVDPKFTTYKERRFFRKKQDRI